MGFLDDAMDSYKAPSAEDLEIELPARREPKKEVAEAGADAPDLGQHGGAAEGTPDAVDAHSDASGGAATAPEPVPQRDEPDDGEHTDSTEHEVAVRAAVAAAAAAAASEPEEEPADAPGSADLIEDTAETDMAHEDEVAQPAPKAAGPPVNVRKVLAGMAGSAPRTFEKTGFSAGGVETLTVTRFPLALVDRLRLSLAPAIGGEFAEALSSTSLITAFLIAKTGVELDVDVNTAVAVEVFRQVDPRLLAVEDKINDMMSDVTRLSDELKRGLKRITDTGDVVDGMEFSVAYLVADRVVGLTTTDTDERSVDVTQKKVLVARESIRTRSKAQRKIEIQRDGRRMA